MLKPYLKVMKALADGNRVKIIKMLQVRELCVCELRTALGLAQAGEFGFVLLAQAADLKLLGSEITQPVLAPESRAMIYGVLGTMRRAIPQVYVIATQGPGREELQNFIFIGHNASRPGERLDLRRAAATEFAYPMLQGVAAQELRVADSLIDGHPVLTDDYAQVEHYAANAIRRHDAVLRRMR